MLWFRGVAAIAASCLALAGKPAAAPTNPPAAAPKLAVPAPKKPAEATDPKLDLAYGAYQRGLYVTAFQEATARLGRDPGDAAAMTLLGELYNQGLGVREDAKQALNWYRLAGQRGDARAMASLAIMAADGRGMAKDPAQARDWLDKAAAKGEPTASYNLALLLLNSGRAEASRVPTLMRVAADAEIGDAQHALGVLYARGEVLPKDTAEAARWFLRAARNGNIAGEVEYAIALFNGEGTTKNEPMAARFFRRAAARGNAIAQNRLARLYATGRGVPRNLIEAAAWHLVASGQGLSDDWLDTALRDLPAQDRTRAEQIAAERAGRS
jgi:TPR repeat protein